MTLNNFKFWPFQIECINSIMNYFRENETGHCLVCLPTGTGKGSLIAGLIHLVLSNWPEQRILQLVHTKELVKQNYDDLLNMWAFAPAGIYCDGLDRKDVNQSAIFGSLGSVRVCPEIFGHRDIIIVDEAHAVSPDEETGYRKIISALTEINPRLRVIGATATPYRLGQGKLTDDGFFTDICFDITGMQAFNRLIAEGYLSPLVIPSQLQTQLDVSGVGISKGDFKQNELQKAVDKQEITFAALSEAIKYSADRQCWLVFASGIEHCEHIAEMLQGFGISAACVHSKIKSNERDERIIAHKEGRLQALVGFRVLTTGYNNPPVDFIIDLYPTVSPNMHVQKYGRGTRKYNGSNPAFPNIKRNCLVLDFAGNTKRLGPINDPIIPRKKGKDGGEAPIKICDSCGLYNHASARYCGGKPFPTDEGCGKEFIFKTKLVTTAGNDAILKTESQALVETVNVDRVIYHRHNKIGSKPSIKVTYYSGLAKYNEYVCLEHSGYAKTRANNWWYSRHNSPPPATTDEALLYVSQLRTPKKIRVRVEGNFTEVLSVEW